MVLSGKVRAAVCMVIDRDSGGLFRPFDKYLKTGRPVIDVLCEKHQEARIPPNLSFDGHPDAEECPESMLVYYFKENIAKAP